MHDYPGVQVAWKRILSIAQNTPDPAAITYKDDDEEEENLLTTPTPATVTRMQRMGRALQNMYTITSQDEGYLAFIVTVVQELNYNCPIAMTFVKHIIDYSEIPSKTTLQQTSQAITSMLIAPRDKLKINASIIWSLLARKFAGNLAEVMWQDNVATILIDSILADSSTGPMVKLFALLALESFALTGSIKKKIIGQSCITSILDQNIKECTTYLSLHNTDLHQLYFVQQQQSSPSLSSNATKSPDLTLLSTIDEKYSGRKFYHGWIHKSKLFSKLKLKKKSRKMSTIAMNLAEGVSPPKSKQSALITSSAAYDGSDDDWCGYMQLPHCLKWSLENTFKDTSLLLQPSITNSIKVGPTSKVYLSSKNSTSHLKTSADCLEMRNDTFFLESARATACVDSGQWYYEVLLLTNGVIQIGWGTHKCLFSPEEGCGVGDDTNGFSFDTYRSAIWAASEAIYPQGQDKSSRCKIGDVIGTLLDMDQGLCTFFINGQDLGLTVQFHTNLKKPMLGLYPILSLTSHQHVIVNFGDRPWSYAPPVNASSFHSMNDKAPCDSTTVENLTRDVKEKIENEEEEELEWDGPLCTLCFSEPKQITLLPCQHAGFGKGCAKILDLCPLCRTKISKRVSTACNSS